MVDMSDVVEQSGLTPSGPNAAIRLLANDFS